MFNAKCKQKKNLSKLILQKIGHSQSMPNMEN